jgi:enoyl-CoA hydratase/carnithine racemase
MTDLVLTQIENRVLTITFNRPEKKNALTQAMYGIAAKALQDAEGDDNVRAILITGSGDAFTAGNDLMDFQQARGLSGDMPVQHFLNALVAADKPIVAAVNGIGVGIGLTMLLHSDLVFMAEHAQIQAPFVDLALVPEAASSLLLVERVGHVRAAEIFMLGKRISAGEAVALGLANAVCKAGDLMDMAGKAAAKLAAKAPRSLQMTKRLMRGDKQILTDRMATEGVYFSEQLQSAEVREAITAFFEKRTPNFG